MKVKKKLKIEKQQNKLLINFTLLSGKLNFYRIQILKELFSQKTIQSKSQKLLEQIIQFGHNFKKTKYI